MQLNALLMIRNACNNTKVFTKENYNAVAMYLKLAEDSVQKLVASGFLWKWQPAVPYPPG